MTLSEYILIVGDDNSNEPHIIRVGESFRSFRLERIEVLPETPHQRSAVVGHFSGEDIVTGTLWAEHGCSTSPEIVGYTFHLHDDYIGVFPRLYPTFGRADFFLLNDVSDASRLLGLNERTIRAIESGAIRNVNVENLTLRVGDFSVSSGSNAAARRFEILEVIAIGEVTYTRHLQVGHVMWGIFVIVILVIAGMCAWRCVRSTVMEHKR